MVPRPRGSQSAAAAASSSSMPADPMAAAWVIMDSTLQQLASSNSTPRDWAAAGSCIQYMANLMDDSGPDGWPAWLLPKLCAALTKGLTAQILSISGSTPRMAVLYQPQSSKNEAQVKLSLAVMCAVGELLVRLSVVLYVVRDGEARQQAGSEAELLGYIGKKAGLLAAIGAAAGHLSAFLAKHKALTQDAKGDGHKMSVSYGMTALTGSLLNVWAVMIELLPGTGLINAPAFVFQTAQPVTSLCVTLLKAYPGPPPPANLPAVNPAMMPPGDAAVDPRELTSAWVYKTQCLPQVVTIAGLVSDAITQDCWSTAAGPPGTALIEKTPQHVLQLLRDEQVKFLMAFAVLVFTQTLHKTRGGVRCLDPASFPTSSRSRKTRRQMREQRQAQQRREQQQQQGSPEVQSKHTQLEAAMGIAGCVDCLAEGTEGGAVEHEIEALHALVAVMCCIAATINAPYVASGARVMTSGTTRTQLLPAGIDEPFMQVLIELLLLEADAQVVVFALQVLQGMLPSLTPETRDNLIQPLIADLACHLVQGVRETDARKGWSSLLNSDGSSQGDHVRGAMLEAAGNFLLVMIDPATSGAKDMDLLSQLIAKQPTVLLSSLDALLRSKAVTEASNTVFCRRVFLYNAPPGIHIPELMRMLQVAVSCSMSCLNGGDHQPSAAAAAVLAGPGSAGAAWVGLLVTAQKYALQALLKVPALCAWDAAAAATLQLLALNVLASEAAGIRIIARSSAELTFNLPLSWTEAKEAADVAGHNSLVRMMVNEGVISKQDAGPEPDSDDEIEPGTGFSLFSGLDEAGVQVHIQQLRQRLGPLLLPVVQMYCRSLLLLTRALLLPPEVMSVGMATLHPVVERFRTAPYVQLKGDAVATAVWVSLQYLCVLLPDLAQQQPSDDLPAAAAGSNSSGADTAAGAASSSSSNAARGAGAAAGLLPADAVQKLMPRLNASSAAVADIWRGLVSTQKKPEKQTKSCSALLLGAQKAFLPKPSISGATSSSSGSSGEGEPVLVQLQQLAAEILSQLPAHKLCTNPSCTQLGCLSERELCEKRCSACKTPYCSKECSRLHWKQHKPLCQRLAAAAAPATDVAPATAAASQPAGS